MKLDKPLHLLHKDEPLKAFAKLEKEGSSLP